MKKKTQKGIVIFLAVITVVAVVGSLILPYII